MPDPIELFVAFADPAEVIRRREKEEQNARGLGASARPIPAHPLSEPDFDWGPFAPIYSSANTTTAAAAILYAKDEERSFPVEPVLETKAVKRYLTACEARAERAVVLYELGRYRDGEPFDPPPSAWGLLPYGCGDVYGEPLPKGAELRLADDLTSAERDLALRLRAAVRRWYRLEWRPGANTAVGITKPLLTTDVPGEVALATWTTPDGHVWILLPWGVPWNTVLSWLNDHGLPELVPGALVRARRTVADGLLTNRERAAAEQLATFEKEVEARRATLEAEVDAARATGDELRYPLLYGTSTSLKLAVKRILEDAGFDVEDLDKAFGSTPSGDLLVSLAGNHWLVEITSSSGSTSEAEIGKLQTHLDTWPMFGRAESLSGGVLIVNHNYNLDVEARPSAPYRRSERIDSLSFPVMGTVPLCYWWVAGDFDAIRNAVMGPPGQIVRE